MLSLGSYQMDVVDIFTLSDALYSSVRIGNSPLQRVQKGSGRGEEEREDMNGRVEAEGKWGWAKM